MVLRRLLAAATLLLAACIGTTHPALRAQKRETVAAAFVLDDQTSRQVGDAPDVLVQRVRAALDARNMDLEVLPAADWANSFVNRRATQSRLQDLATRAPGADAVLLIETKAQYFTALNGRFRWTVTAKGTLAHRNALNDALSTQIEFPAILDFEFQHEPEAVAASAPDVADRIGELADQYLGAEGAGAGGDAPTAWKPAGVGPGDSIYFVMVDRFFNGDHSNDGEIDPKDPQAFHGGDLQGVLDKLDYIQGLGFNTVWLSPVFKMRTAKLEGHGAFHGYWVEDFGKIEPRFGDESLLRKLSDELHRRGMKLLLDVVLNHVGYDAPLTKEHPDWFHHNGDIKDWNDPSQLVNNDVHGLPDLAQENEEVYRYLVEKSEYWIDTIHPDGFRLDAVKHIPISFWSRYNDEIRKHAGESFFLLGEDLDGDPVRVAKTMRDGHFTSMFDFPLYFATIDVFCKGAPAERIGAILSQDSAYEHPERLVSLVDNHDLPRLASACANDKARSLLSLSFSGSVRGITSLTYGTENLVSGEAEPLNRPDMTFQTPAPALDVLHAASVLRQTDRGAFKAGAPMRLSSDDASGLRIDRFSRGRMIELQVRADAKIPDLTVKTVLKPGRAGSASDDRRTLPIELSATAPLKEGDELRLVGSGPLGDWDPKSGIPFAFKDDKGSASVAVKVGQILECKLVIRHADGSVEWEKTGNRYVVSKAGLHRIEMTWNAPAAAHATIQ